MSAPSRSPFPADGTKLTMTYEVPDSSCGPATGWSPEAGESVDAVTPRQRITRRKGLIELLVQHFIQSGRIGKAFRGLYLPGVGTLGRPSLPSCRVAVLCSHHPPRARAARWSRDQRQNAIWAS